MAKKQSLRAFNLNLLPILREVLRHGNLTKAAAALNLSQPALSSALKQLRGQFGDELIVRSGSQVKLTPLAESLISPLEQALASVETVLGEGQDETRAEVPMLHIATTDHIMRLIGPRMAKLASAKEIPFRLQFLTVGLHSVAQLTAGAIDLVIIPKITMATGLAAARTFDQILSQPFFEEKMVCMARADDDAAHADMALVDYLSRPHICFSADSTFAITAELQFLASQGLRQNNVIHVASYGAIPPILSANGGLAVLPERSAKEATGLYPLKQFDPPLPFPALEWMMIWQRHHGRSPMHEELRRSLLEAVAVD